ncbi:MAG: DUF1614 domain-containing protein [Methanocellales archaeon]|nr:DUF1614 domain-containing protein [Methanocellales archaeon]
MIFVILMAIELLALYFYQVGFTFSELILLIAFPLFSYSSTLAMRPELMNIAIMEIHNKVIGFHIIGVGMPLIVSVKILVQKRLPLGETALITGIVAIVASLYTHFDPEIGIIVRFFAIPPMLAAAIAFVLRRDPRIHKYNTALMTYVCGTLGMLIGADLFHFHQILLWIPNEPVFVSIGGAGLTDAIFLSGIIAILFDLIFTCQICNVLRDYLKFIKSG